MGGCVADRLALTTRRGAPRWFSRQPQESSTQVPLNEKSGLCGATPGNRMNTASRST